MTISELRRPFKALLVHSRHQAEEICLIPIQASTFDRAAHIRAYTRSGFETIVLSDLPCIAWKNDAVHIMRVCSPRGAFSLLQEAGLSTLKHNQLIKGAS